MSRSRKLILARRDGMNEIVFVRFDGGCVVVSENRKDALHLSNMTSAQGLKSKLRSRSPGEWEIINLYEEGS